MAGSDANKVDASVQTSGNDVDEGTSAVATTMVPAVSGVRDRLVETRIALTAAEAERDKISIALTAKNEELAAKDQELRELRNTLQNLQG